MNAASKSDTPDVPPEQKQAPEQLMAMSFARKLQGLRLDRRMSQSDLARKIWGNVTDKHGNVGAKNRDRISQYEKGKIIPERATIMLLAEALGVQPDELGLPADLVGISREPPAFQMQALPDQPNRTRLSINVICSTDVATKVIAMLTADPGLEAGSK